MDSVEKLGFSTGNPEITLFHNSSNWSVFPEICTAVTTKIRVTETLFSPRIFPLFQEKVEVLYKPVSLPAGSGKIGK